MVNGDTRGYARRMKNDLIVVAGSAALLGLVGLAVVAVALALDLLGPRRRSWIAEDGRPEPRTPEDWRRASDAGARASAARRAS